MPPREDRDRRTDLEPARPRQGVGHADEGVHGVGVDVLGQPERIHTVHFETVDDAAETRQGRTCAEPDSEADLHVGHPTRALPGGLRR